jgi:hypothetical protein
LLKGHALLEVSSLRKLGVEDLVRKAVDAYTPPIFHWTLWAVKVEKDLLN